jgi:hypothetical protein
MKHQNLLKSFKVGSIVLSTNQGLSYLAKDFFDNGIIDKVYVHPHTTRENHYDWYPDRVKSPNDLLDCDVLLFFETPFDFDLMKRAKDKGIKIVFMPMYECSNPKIVEMADVILNPSDLDQQFYPRGVRVTVPVNVKWKLRKKALIFVHNAGNGGLGGRNGTKELIEAFRHVKSPAQLVIRSQVPIQIPDDERIGVRVGTFDNIWEEGDVFVFPEKFNGLSLPLQEAFASGMAVMCGDRFPVNTWLPKDMLIPVSGYKKESLAVSFDSAIIKPEEIAKCIDKLYNNNISEYSLLGKQFNKNNSWKKWKEKYIKLM